MKPITRIERYLAYITRDEDSTGIDDPITRVEMYLAKIAGLEIEIPERPITRVEMYLAKIAGEDVDIPDRPITRVEMYLAAIAGEEIEVPIPITRVEQYLYAWVNLGPAWEIVTITGVSPLALQKALQQPIRSITQHGKCVQASTPTPSAHVDIVCNNGALGMVDDELPSGYKRVLGFTCANNAMWQIAGFKLRGSDTVRISFSVTQACNVFGCYQGTDANDNYDLYVSTTAGSKYLRYGNGTYLSYWSSADLGERFDVVFTPTGTSGMPQDSTWTAKTFESANDLLIGSTTLTGSSSKLRGNLYGEIIVDGRLKLIPCERQSDGVLGYYDTYSGTFFEPYTGFTGAVSLGYDGSHYSLAVVGTDEVLTVSATGADPQTASVVDLLGITDYADEQEIISGAVTHKVGYYIFDGSETLSTSTAYGKCILLQSAAMKFGSKKNCTPICSHFVGTAMRSSGTANEDDCFFNGSGHFYFRVDDNNTDTFKAWLAAQYANGTPVIVLYPLATETTEQTTPHSLNTSAGDNVVSVLSNVDPVTLSVEYAAEAS